MYSISGLTSPKVQKFLNTICKDKNSYLEIGSYLGATAVAALDGNQLAAYFVDNWKDQVQAFRDDIELPKNNKEEFIKNVKSFKGENTIKIFDCDMFNTDLSEIDPIEVFFYDADHDPEITSKAIQYFSNVFADEVIVIIDDANFDGVVQGARNGINNTRFVSIFERIILNDIEDENAWWNGLYILILKKEK